MQDNKLAGADPAGKSAEFDLIVIGGGITGCGVARDAALRGLRVVLLEMNDFASGTSSRSSRLVHGGVRYLEHGWLHLVFEASAERRRLLRVAPHLVRPLKFTWPVYRGARVPLWKVVAGLSLYDVLALFRNVGRHRVLSKGWMRRDQPAVLAEGLVGGATYYDASTDDTRLTLAVAMDARDRGATILNHTKVERVIIEHGIARGVVARDVLTGSATSFRAPMIVNATGPWSDGVRALEGARAPSQVHGSKGVHIAVPRGRLGNRGAFTLLSPKDGRVMFVLPGEAHAIIGTTDTFTSSPPETIRATEADVAYLLDAANHFFPQARLDRDDVISAWAGIRPLAAADTDDPGSASREHTIAVTEAGVVTITGGKLTTFRVMAEQAVDRALRAARLPFVPGRTAEAPIGWDFPRPPRDVAALQIGIARAMAERNDSRVARMVIRYGSKWRLALAAIDRSDADAERIHPEHTYRYGDLRFACEHEAARTLGDLLIRRTHLAFERRDNAVALAPRVAAYVAPILGWSAADVRDHLDRYASEIDAMFTILSS